MNRDGDSPVRRPGRPVRFQPESAEAGELARWLDQLINDRKLTVRELASRFEYGKTKWAEFRNGSRLIPSWLLEKMVRELVPEPAAQRRMLRQGRELLARAERAAAGMPSAADRHLSELELKDRLSKARRQQDEAQRKLAGMTALVVVLLSFVASLTTRCQELAEHDAPLRERREYNDRLARAEAQLDEARQGREEAEGLRQEAHLLAERYRRALGGPSLPTTATAVFEDPPAIALSEEECDRLLEVNARHLRQARHALDDLRIGLGLPPRSVSSDRIVRGQLVDDREDNAGGADKADNARVGGPAGHREGDPPRPRRKRRIGVAWTAGAAVVLLPLAAWGGASLLGRPSRTAAGAPPASAAVSRSGTPSGGTPMESRTPASTATTSRPPAFRSATYEPVITVGDEWVAPDRGVHINVPSGSTSEGPDVFITTPTNYCSRDTVAIGEALVVPETRGSSWTRVTVESIWAKDLAKGQKTDDGADFEIYTKLLIEQGSDHAPGGKRCG